MRYYVYALIDPTNDDHPFYIGKGINNRVQSHFKEAASYNQDGKDDIIEECYINSIMENEMNEHDKNELEKPKIKKINELFEKGFDYTNIARIIAKNLDESVALAIESLLIKSVYGLENLTNLIAGENAERFRPYNNWNCIDGFDLPSCMDSETRTNRNLNDLPLMLATGLDDQLIEIQNAFPNLKFNRPRIKDSGELSIEANVGDDKNQSGAVIKIFTRKRNSIQIELRGRKKYQKQWMLNHFSKLEASSLIRKSGDVFLPNKWKRGNIANNVSEAIERVELLLEIVKIENKNELSPKALSLLMELPND